MFYLTTSPLSLSLIVGNVICLDVLRAMKKEPQALAVFLQELNVVKGYDKRYDNLLGDIHAELRDTHNMEARARRVVDKLALAFQGSLLLRRKDGTLGEAFCATRLSGYDHSAAPKAGLHYGNSS
jgi:putative acyl-CoA dehydrogenase